VFGTKERVRNFPEEREGKLYFWRNEKLSPELMEIFPATLMSLLSLGSVWNKGMQNGRKDKNVGMG
jgi:hypothetical protein